MNAANFGQFPQGMDFMKQFWQSGVASTATDANATPSPAPTATPAFSQAMGQYFLPTMDVDELDRRLSDLRTVLQFMEMNTQMLRQSLNALEVQRNTLAALKAMTQPASDAAATQDDASPVAPWLAAMTTMMNAAQTMAATVKPATENAKQGAASTAAPIKPKASTKPSKTAAPAPAGKRSAPKP